MPLLQPPPPRGRLASSVRAGFDRNVELAWTNGPGESPLYVAQASAAEQPGTAICRLISGILAREGFASLRILRRRLYTTTAQNALDAGLVKLAAKRCTFGAVPDLQSLARAVDLSGLPLGDPTADRTAALGGVGVLLTPAAAAAACRVLADAVPLEPERFASPRPVAALALDAEGRLLGAAVNNNVVNRLQHAEFNLVFNHFAERRLPAGATVYTSLSPCRMCAALLARAAADAAAVGVVALAMDTGRFGRQSAVTTRLWTGG